MSETSPPADLAPENQPPKGALFAIFLIVLTDFIGFGIIIPLLPFMVPDYQENSLKVGLIFSIFSVCQFFAAPVLGALSDRYGRKPVLAISQVGSAVGYLLLAAAVHMKDAGADPATVLAVLYLSRIIDGISGGNVSTAQAYISDVTTPQTRARGMGMIGAAFGIGFSLGPAMGGILGHYNHAYPAYAAAALALLAAVLSVVKLTESRVHKPVDVEVWLHPRTFLPVLKRPVILQLLLIAVLTQGAFVMMEAVIGLFLNKQFRWEERSVGWFFAWAGLWIIIVQGGLVGRLTKRLGEWPLSILGPVLVALGMFGFTLNAWYASLGSILLAGAVNAIGRSFQQPTLSSLLSKYSERHEQGVVFGLYHGLMSLARVIGPIVAGLTYPLVHNTGPFLTAAALTLVAALWTLALRAKYPTPEVAKQGNGEFAVAQAARTEIE